MKVIRKELTPAELEPTTIRYNEDCSCVQSLVGDEWVDNPQADPRTSPTYQYPPPDTADPACDAGERISAGIEHIISTVFDAVSVIEAVSTMIGVVAVFFPPIALFVALLFALVSAANAIGFAAVQLSFTDMVYEQIACIVYCNIGSDGQFDEDEWNAFQDAIGATFGLSTVTAILALMFNGMGMVAFNNLASSRTETGDCDECSCSWCQEWDEAAVYSGLSWTITNNVTSHAITIAEASLGAVITHAEFDYALSGFGAFGDGQAQIYDQDFPSSTLQSGAATDPTGTLAFDDPLGVTVTEFGFAISSLFASGSNYPVITRIHLEGLGVKPAFADGVDCL